MAGTHSFVCLVLGLLPLSIPFAVGAYDELATFCVADLKGPVLVTGYPCKNSSEVTVDDFFYSGLNRKATKSLPKGSSVFLSWATVREVPALNSAGVSFARVEHEPGALFPFHVNHVWEVDFIINGTIEIGIVTGYHPELKLSKKVLNAGDMFVIPQGVMHYHRNVGKETSTAVVALGGQNIQPIFLAENLFGTKPEKIDTEVLAKAFKVDDATIEKIAQNFS